MKDKNYPRTLHELLVRQAVACGKAPALVVPNGTALSYDGLLLEVERNVAVLASAGIGRGTRVAMSFPNGADALVLTLALMAGAACVPMNPALDPLTCDALLRKLRVTALIAPEGTETPAVATARVLGLQLLRLVSRGDGVPGAFDLRVETPGHSVLQAWPQPQDLAILFQTSGTTAQPKTVPLTQAQVMARSRAQPITSDDVCLFVPPMYTAGAMAHSMLAPLAAGARIAFPRGPGEVALLDAMEGLEVTYFSANPAVFASLLERLAERPSNRFASLRFIRSAGSALTSTLQVRVEEAFRVPVIQGYGISEVGTIAGNPLPPGRRKHGSVGLSVGPEIAIAGDSGERLSSNMTGEIVVRSPGVTSGYENDPGADRDAFRDGWFRTGDLGHLDEDGYLFVTGRIKEIINRGGFKVSPAEVDVALLRHPDVVDAAAFGVDHPTLGEDVAAAVVIRDRGKISPQQLREFALEHLAAYKVPSTIVFVPALPRNAARKTDRKALARDLESALCRSFVPPRNAQEELVATLFAQVLGVERVGVNDNFFDLGGDSLRGMRVITRVNQALGSNLVVASLFRWPTVADLAAAITAGGLAQDRSAPVSPA